MAERPRRLPSLNGLRAFEVAARQLNFRLAAEELGVTQGAVAQQVRGLEAELGMKLFERHPRALSLSQAGRSYIANIRRAFELISEATETLRPEPHHLTVSVPPTFASKWLIPRLPDFTSSNPEIELRIVASDRVSNFQTDGVDLAVRYGHAPFGPGLSADLLFEQVVIAVASPLLVEKLGRPDDGANFANYSLLHDAHDCWPQFLDLAFPLGAPAPAKNIRFNQTSLAIEAAIAGQGLALTSHFYVEGDVASGRLIRLFSVRLRVGSGFYIVSPRRARSPRPVGAVKAWLAAAARMGSGCF